MSPRSARDGSIDIEPGLYVQLPSGLCDPGQATALQLWLPHPDGNSSTALQSCYEALGDVQSYGNGVPVHARAAAAAASRKAHPAGRQEALATGVTNGGISSTITGLCKKIFVAGAVAHVRDWGLCPSVVWLLAWGLGLREMPLDGI